MDISCMPAATVIMTNVDSIKVGVRIRPFNQREKILQSKCIISMTRNNVEIIDPKNAKKKKTFVFDYCYWSHDEYVKNELGIYIPDGPESRYADQVCVFNDVGKAVLNNAWRGYNTTLFAYGQTGSGKSYTVTGSGLNKGLVPLICEMLFKEIRQQECEEKQFQVHFSMLEICNEQVIDLLSKDRKPGGLRVREGRHGFYVEYLKAVPCDSHKKIEALFEEGLRNGNTTSTSMNTSCSRSHLVIKIHFKQVHTKELSLKVSEIDLVDLAGSEKQRTSYTTNDHFVEARAINLSLTTLGNVISALSDKSTGKKVYHIPYRNSVLTKLLSTALGGNSKTVMVASLSPADISYEESLSTLRLAERVKNIQNQAIINNCTILHVHNDLKEENARLQAKIMSLQKAEFIHLSERGNLQLFCSLIPKKCISFAKIA
ncbi:kinesin-like protein KIF28P [Protopterus annectens]|uniref:kinesin-like protein KIF28P n=1 Tax=Protopterus annectens TaxID=7888 RepID=UPI001CFBDC09|nr:kinesin-like protein KIF28P [Protopterus annectens]